MKIKLLALAFLLLTLTTIGQPPAFPIEYGDYVFHYERMGAFLHTTHKAKGFDWDWEPMQFEELGYRSLHFSHVTHFHQTAMDHYPDRIFQLYFSYLFMVKNFIFDGVPREWYAGSRVGLINCNLLFQSESIHFRQLAFHYLVMDVMQHVFRTGALADQLRKGSKFKHLEWMAPALPFSPENARIQEKYHPLGYLSVYSMVSPLADMQALSAAMFSQQPGFWNAYSNHELIRQKADGVIRFWHQLDSRIDLDYLRALPRDDWHKWDSVYAKDPVPHF